MNAKNEAKVRQIREWAVGRGYTQDRYGNLKKEENGRHYRFKIQATSIRYEVRTESGDWVRIRGAYLKDITITPEGKIAGMRRGY